MSILNGGEESGGRRRKIFLLVRILIIPVGCASTVAILVAFAGDFLLALGLFFLMMSWFAFLWFLGRKAKGLPLVPEVTEMNLTWRDLPEKDRKEYRKRLIEIAVGIGVGTFLLKVAGALFLD